MTSIETRNVRFFTFVFSIKFIKSVVSLRYDFCIFGIGCSNVSTKEEILYRYRCAAFHPLHFLMLDLKRCCLVCSPVWILDISNIWKHHAKVRTTDIHNVVLYAKI